MEISVVIPVYNEEGNLASLFKRLCKSMDEIGRPWEAIFVNDGSRDASAEIMRKAAEAKPNQVIACILNRNYGQHSAIMAGFSLVRGDLVITLDADLQNPPEEIPNLVAAAERGNDVVGTVRQNRQDTWFRRTASKIVNRVAQKATGVKMHDYGCMLRAYRSHVVKAMLQCNERSTFIPVLGNSFARNTCEIPVAHNERAVGDSKYSLMKLINLQFNMLTCMTTAPLRVLTWFGMLAAFCGFLLSLYIIIRRVTDGDTWTNGGVFTLFAVMFVFMGIQMVGIGMIGGTWREFGLYHKLCPAGRRRMSTLPIVLGRGLVYALIYAVTCTYILGLHYRLFHFPMNGATGAVMLFMAAYLAACIAMGIAVSTLFRYRENSLLLLLWTSIPVLMLSGVSYPRQGIPDWLFNLGQLFPSSHGVNGFIRIQTMGASIPEVFAEIKWLIILTVVYGGLACIGIHQVIGREQREHPARKENGDEGR